MSQLLKVPQLAHQHGVAQVQIRRSRIESRLHPQRPSGFAALFQALAQVAHADNLRRALLEQVHLFIDREKLLWLGLLHVPTSIKFAAHHAPNWAARNSTIHFPTTISLHPPPRVLHLTS